jgi:hypothetical protein
MVVVFSHGYIINTILGRVIAQSLCYWILSAFFVLSGARVLTLLARASRVRGTKDRRQIGIARFIIVDAVLLTSFGFFIYSFTAPSAQSTNMWYELKQTYYLLFYEDE